MPAARASAQRALECPATLPGSSVGAPIAPMTARLRYPLVVGRLAQPGLIAQALAPPAGAFVLTHASPDALWWLLLALSLANLGLVGALWRVR